MAAPKTKPTEADVEAYLASRASPQQLADCRVIMDLLGRATGESPRMWGPSIVGYGKYAYRYPSGHSGEMCVVGFAVRGKELVVYLIGDGPAQEELLAKLGKHRMGKACLYLKRLADVDLGVLGRLVDESIAEARRRYPG